MGTEILRKVQENYGRWQEMKGSHSQGHWQETRGGYFFFYISDIFISKDNGIFFFNIFQKFVLSNLKLGRKRERKFIVVVLTD